MKIKERIIIEHGTLLKNHLENNDKFNDSLFRIENVLKDAYLNSNIGMDDMYLSSVAIRVLWKIFHDHYN